MSIFKRKPKADKDSSEKGKKSSKEDAKKAVPDKPTHSQPYKPTHAASDAVRRPATINGRNYSRDAADYAQRSANVLPAQNGNQPFTHTGMRPVVTGVNPLPPVRNLAGGFTAMQRNNSAEVFTTDPEAPPMPTASISERGQLTPQNETSRQNGGYFSQQQRNNGPSFDSQRNKAPSFDTQRNNAHSYDNPMLGNTKLAVAARDRQGLWLRIDLSFSSSERADELAEWGQASSPTGQQRLPARNELERRACSGAGFLGVFVWSR
ncbi:hypothetical protein LTR32_003479 [Rachicladosporium monterosium]|uniref:Uncharacterized protein n=1 Tax=Rachicladosporium monterosium TaxID=1507873 RepID=A0ABR0L7C6_9PEZI|nr:hypothetical protein LTR32_003479 [Rachicladosporium monterosium]